MRLPGRAVTRGRFKKEMSSDMSSDPTGTTRGLDLTIEVDGTL